MKFNFIWTTDKCPEHRKVIENLVSMSYSGGTGRRLNSASESECRSIYFSYKEKRSGKINREDISPDEIINIIFSDRDYGKKERSEILAILDGGKVSPLDVRAVLSACLSYRQAKIAWITRPRQPGPLVRPEDHWINRR